ncbi:MAG: glycosyltransferase family 2 protein [Bacteroidota bacterium]|nr:glycosyltransferase family 2 protein [Bacteroidota bacterium]
MDISVVVPLLNEEESLPELIQWIKKVMTTHQFTFEIILVDDGSKDNSWHVIQELSEIHPEVKGIKFRKNYGKSAALHTGFSAVKGDVVITMDADLQDNPDEIPDLFRMIKEEDYDLVSGWKKKRYDPISKTIPSKLYNRTARILTGIKLHDFNCGLKAYKNEVVKNIEVYGEMHRYIPVIAKKAGFSNIGEKIVQHQARKYGVTKFGLDRFIKGYLDLLSITFISKFSQRPMHLFGTLGTLMFFAGFLAAAWLGGQKLYFLWNNIKAPLVTDSPVFYIALTSMIMGTQLFLAGFLGELISRNSSDRNDYQIEQKINL